MSAAEVLRRHLWRGEILGCGCGWNWPEERTYFCGEEDRISEAHVEHQLGALKAAGYAVVELPKPEAQSPHSWLDGSVTATRGLGRVRLYQEDHRLTASDARDVATALLAAADAAEVSNA